MNKFKKQASWVMGISIILVMVLGVGFAINKANAGTGDYDFTNFSVNGFMLGADTKKMNTSALTPTEPLKVSDGYDFNFEEICYSAKESTGRLVKMLVNVYGGADIPSVIIHKGEEAVDIPYTLNSIEQVTDIFGQGKSGWQDREQRLRYMEYRQREGRLSATVRFVHTDGVSEGIEHRLVWVIAESSLPYPYPVETDGIVPSPEATKPWGLLANADLDKDGREEAIYLDKTQMENTLDVTLRVLDGGGNEIWSESANTVHAGWNSLFLCEQDSENYLLRYNPTMYQGYCTYVYTIFTLEGGRENVVRSNRLEFDINGAKELDAPKMIAFADEVNALLGRSILLMSTVGGEYSFGPSSADLFFERYSWLDGYPELFEDGDSLETRLVKFSEYAVANRQQAQRIP